MLSTFGFRFNLRRYMKDGKRRAIDDMKTTPQGLKILNLVGSDGFENYVQMIANPELRVIWENPTVVAFLKVRRCSFTLSNPR